MPNSCRTSFDKRGSPRQTGTASSSLWSLNICAVPLLGAAPEEPGESAAMPEHMRVDMPDPGLG